MMESRSFASLKAKLSPSPSTDVINTSQIDKYFSIPVLKRMISPSIHYPFDRTMMDQIHSTFVLCDIPHWSILQLIDLHILKWEQNLRSHHFRVIISISIFSMAWMPDPASVCFLAKEILPELSHISAWHGQTALPPNGSINSECSRYSMHVQHSFHITMHSNFPLLISLSAALESASQCCPVVQ